MTSKDRRRRELARERYERQEARRQQKQQRTQRRQRILVLAVVGVLVLGMGIGLVLSLLSRDDGTADAAATAPAGPCQYLTLPAANQTDVGLPPADPGDLGPLSATMTLNGEPVTITLDSEGAPCTVSSWQFLAANDFFDDTPCHRLTSTETLKVLQCGDPSGTGTGGPGYRFAEENLEGATYGPGTVAMANTGGEVSTGSQFFLVWGETELPPTYTVVGQITDGLDVLTDIAEVGSVDGATDGEPAEPVTVDDLVVERSPA
jgi:peptidyl-prolyl cis-trans isomerase B (cyclophilin B)